MQSVPFFGFVCVEGIGLQSFDLPKLYRLISGRFNNALELQFPFFSSQKVKRTYLCGRDASSFISQNTETRCCFFTWVIYLLEHPNEETFICIFELCKVAKFHVARDYFWCKYFQMKVSLVAFKDLPILE